MKIGILTYHWAVNYGAVLQAYALQKHLSDTTGAEVQIIDFSPPDLVSFYGSNPFQPGLSMRDRIGRVLYGHRKTRRRAMFRTFLEENVPLSPPASTFEELKDVCSSFDVLITGSDQVWNPDICHDHLRAYLLGWNTGFLTKGSYAASFGADWVKDRHVDLMKEAIASLGFVSMREKAGAKLVDSMTGRKVPHVMDPVFLLAPEVWRSFPKSCRMDRDYIFVYSLQKTPEFIQKLKHIQNQLGLPVVDVLPRNSKKQAQEITPFHYYDVDPGEWVSLLAGARMVVTDSFHCSAFSILLEKPFISFTHSKRDDRVRSLLSLTGLQDRQWGIDEAIPDVETWLQNSPEGTYPVLLPEIERSKQFLSQAIEEIRGYRPDKNC